MRCPDCPERPGKYIGANVVEDCQRCEGVGELNDDGSVIDAKAKALDSVFHSNLPDWMEDYQDQIGNPQRTSFLPELKVGDTLYVYDAGWYKAEVKDIFPNMWSSRRPRPIVIRATTSCDTFHILLSALCYNVTQGRWEYIRVGTPIWP